MQDKHECHQKQVGSTSYKCPILGSCEATACVWFREDWRLRLKAAQKEAGIAI